MALIIEFSRRSTSQLHKILEFYDERNGSDTVCQVPGNDIQEPNKD